MRNLDGPWILTTRNDPARDRFYPRSPLRTTAAGRVPCPAPVAENGPFDAFHPAKIPAGAVHRRRAYLDVLGRIPSIDEATAFLGSREKGKRAKVVEYLLRHEDFAKNFANQWTVILIGRGRQERQVDRAALTAWLRQQLNADRP